MRKISFTNKNTSGKKKQPKFRNSDAADQRSDTEEEEVTEYEKPHYLPKFTRVFVYLTLIVAVSFLLSWFGWKWMADVFAFSKPDREVQVVVSEGESIDEVVDDLYEKNMIDYKWLFRLFCTVTHAEKKIDPGIYTLNRIYDYNAIINGLRTSSENRAVVQVTVPEGYTCRQIFALLEEKGVCTQEELEHTSSGYMFEYDFLEELPFGSSYRLEGYMFPDTYLFYVDDDPVRVIEKFLDNFERKFNEDYRQDIDSLNERLSEQMAANGFTKEEIAASMMDMRKIVIVASMIERETGSVSESSSISSVIYNRLSSKNYPLLQIDATLRYVLDKWAEPLTSADMLFDSGYNTSRRAGLPEGPISNPGINSIRAALYPRDTQYYFYALNPRSGLHHFSETSYEHEEFLNSLYEEAENE